MAADCCGADVTDAAGLTAAFETGVADDEFTNCLTELFPLTAKLANALLNKLFATEPDAEATETVPVLDADAITFGSTAPATEEEAGD